MTHLNDLYYATNVKLKFFMLPFLAVAPTFLLQNFVNMFQLDQKLTNLQIINIKKNRKNNVTIVFEAGLTFVRQI